MAQDSPKQGKEMDVKDHPDRVMPRHSFDEQDYEAWWLKYESNLAPKGKVSDIAMKE